MTAAVGTSELVETLTHLEFEPPCENGVMCDHAAAWAARLATRCEHAPTLFMACDGHAQLLREVCATGGLWCTTCKRPVRLTSIEPLRGPR
jgi:hypothetical protein